MRGGQQADQLLADVIPSDITEKQRVVIEKVARFVASSSNPALYQHKLREATKHNSNFAFLRNPEHPHYNFMQYLVTVYQQHGGLQSSGVGKDDGSQPVVSFKRVREEERERAQAGRRGRQDGPEFSSGLYAPGHNPQQQQQPQAQVVPMVGRMNAEAPPSSGPQQPPPYGQPPVPQQPSQQGAGQAYANMTPEQMAAYAAYYYAQQHQGQHQHQHQHYGGQQCHGGYDRR